MCLYHQLKFLQRHQVINVDNSILHDSIFEVDPNGHGGNHRTAQIAELVSAAGLEISEGEKIGTTRWSRYVNGIYLLAKYKLNIYPSYSLVGVCGHQYQIYQHAFTKHPGKKLLLWESTANHIAPYAAKDTKFKIIAIPQNLESLVVGHVDFLTRKSLPESFESEIKHFSIADAVFCISREEQWLLKLRGINADFLPYYPPESIFLNLLEVRKLRNQLQNKRFLILGSVINPPTRLGMIEQIQWLNRIRKKIPFEVDIAGYGTEQLKEYCDRPSLTLHGTVDPQELNNLLINAKAVLLHQRATSGALTRIPEMLIAGIPAIANSNACRSAFSYPGVYCYDNESELAELMSKQLDSPSVLQRPIEAEKRFIDCLKQLAQ